MPPAKVRASQFLICSSLEALLGANILPAQPWMLATELVFPLIDTWDGTFPPLSFIVKVLSLILFVIVHDPPQVPDLILLFQGEIVPLISRVISILRLPIMRG